jgi:hypothetical protein
MLWLLQSGFTYEAMTVCWFFTLSIVIPGHTPQACTYKMINNPHNARSSLVIRHWSAHARRREMYSKNL